MSGASGGMMTLGIFASHQTATQQMEQTYSECCTSDSCSWGEVASWIVISGASGLGDDGIGNLCKSPDSNATNETDLLLTDYAGPGDSYN